MRSIQAGQLQDDMSRPGLVNQFTKRYLPDDVLGEAYDAVATAPHQPHEKIMRLETGSNRQRADARLYSTSRPQHITLSGS